MNQAQTWTSLFQLCDTLFELCALYARSVYFQTFSSGWGRQQCIWCTHRLFSSQNQPAMAFDYSSIMLNGQLIKEASLSLSWSVTDYWTNWWFYYCWIVFPPRLTMQVSFQKWFFLGFELVQSFVLCQCSGSIAPCHCTCLGTLSSPTSHCAPLSCARNLLLCSILAH